jgi:maltose-binding protein MalE
MTDRRRRTFAATAFVAVLVLAGCGSDGDDPATTTSTTTTTTSSSTGSSDTTATTVDGTVVEVSVADGGVAGGAEHVEVDVGEALTIRVTSDVEDEVHVHGYDLLADVGPGSPAEISFTADIPGVFEVELEGAGLELIELQVG